MDLPAFRKGFPCTQLFRHSREGSWKGSLDKAPNRAPIGQTNLGDVWFFSLFFKVFYGIFGVYIIPKWLIKVPGHIPILFGWFRELRNFCQNLVLETSGLSPKCFKQYKKIMESSWKNIIYVNLGLTTFRKFLKFGPTKHLFIFLICFASPHPPKRLVSPSVFKEFSVVESWYFRTIIFWKY